MLQAFKCGNKKSVREYIDEEFAFSLLEKADRGDSEAIHALLWLSQFNDEYYNGFLRKNDPAALHNNDRLYKSVTSQGNARKRDLVTALRTGKLAADPILPSIDFNHEDKVLDLISIKRAHSVWDRSKE